MRAGLKMDALVAPLPVALQANWTEFVDAPLTDTD